MADHITEEEQIEALKRWWDENGKQVVLAIVLTVGGYFGWQAYGPTTLKSKRQPPHWSISRCSTIDVMTTATPGR